MTHQQFSHAIVPPGYSPLLPNVIIRAFILYSFGSPDKGPYRREVAPWARNIQIWLRFPVIYMVSSTIPRGCGRVTIYNKNPQEFLRNRLILMWGGGLGYLFVRRLCFECLANR